MRWVEFAQIEVRALAYASKLHRRIPSDRQRVSRDRDVTAADGLRWQSATCTESNEVNYGRRPRPLSLCRRRANGAIVIIVFLRGVCWLAVIEGPRKRDEVVRAGNTLCSEEAVDG